MANVASAGPPVARRRRTVSASGTAAGIHRAVASVTTSSTQPSTRASIVSSRCSVASCSGVFCGSKSPPSSLAPISSRLDGSIPETASSSAEVSMVMPAAYCSTSTSSCVRSQVAEENSRWRAHSRRVR